mmetsp:Transcript_18321/g.38486  ORF Transcript_18321/g.38486 Transcript_18321/m.38486 type:complete len:202 (-) Transcript_18321:5-610(-)
MSTSTTTEGTTTATTTTTMGGGDVLRIGIAFVKQYYQFLSSQPELLEKFYSPTSDAYLSHGEGSEPTQPVSPAGTDHKANVWGCAEGETMIFEFDDGAIDAQPSANEGILLLVTASVIYGVRETRAERRRKFVQTFFLAKTGRRFAVLNDILRFLVTTESADFGVAASTVNVNVNANIATAASEQATTNNNNNSTPAVLCC